mgnify:CR=1 FL=1
MKTRWGYKATSYVGYVTTHDKGEVVKTKITGAYGSPQPVVSSLHNTLRYHRSTGRRALSAEVVSTYDNRVIWSETDHHSARFWWNEDPVCSCEKGFFLGRMWPFDHHQECAMAQVELASTIFKLNQVHQGYKATTTVLREFILHEVKVLEEGIDRNDATSVLSPRVELLLGRAQQVLIMAEIYAMHFSWHKEVPIYQPPKHSE